MFIRNETATLGSIPAGTVFLAAATFTQFAGVLMLKTGSFVGTGLTPPPAGISVAVEVVTGAVHSFNDTDVVTV